MQDPTLHIQKVQITAFQSVSTAAQPPQLPAVDATDIEQAMAASTAGATSVSKGNMQVFTLCGVVAKRG